MRRFFIWKNSHKLKIVLRFLGLFLLVFILVYLLVNSPALFKKFKFKTKTNQVQSEVQITKTKSSVIPKDNRLVISKINLDAPIIFSDNLEEKEITESLKNGVVWWPDTAFPGEEGNCVITGHSSDFFWKKGNYKTIFALLGELNEGDEIIIYFDQQKFVYKVKTKEIVSANNTNILSQTPLSGANKKEPLTGSVRSLTGPVGPTLTLFTCWPLGTDLKRLVVEAELKL